MNINDLESEIFRTYRVLLSELAFGQNEMDIMCWKNEGYITPEQANHLYALNRRLYRASKNRN